MILPYTYWYFQSALSDTICDAILEHGISKMHDNVKQFGPESIVATTGDFKQKNSPILENSDKMISVKNYTAQGIQRKGLSVDDVYLRDSNVAFLNDVWLCDLLWPYIHEANKLAGWNFEWDFTEDFQFTKYAPGQFYGWHADAAPVPYAEYKPAEHEQLRNNKGNLVFDFDNNPVPKNSNLTLNPKMIGKIRKLSVTVSLSDPKNYKGGNLKFDFGPHSAGGRYHTCTEIRPRGSIIVFPSHVYHQVTPVTQGTRYSLVAWNLGYPFK